MRTIIFVPDFTLKKVALQSLTLFLHVVIKAILSCLMILNLLSLINPRQVESLNRDLKTIGNLGKKFKTEFSAKSTFLQKKNLETKENTNVLHPEKAL